MVKGKKILFDIDGVLADFVTPFTELAHQMFGTPVHGTDRQLTYDYFGGLSPKERGQVWEQVATRINWWTTLPPLIEGELFSEIDALSYYNTIVFCTDRKIGYPSTQVQTSNWLKMHGINYPNVVISKRKGEIARAMDADYSIEDKTENANCIHWISDARPTKSFLIDRLYNQEGRVKNLTVVKTVEEFLEAML